MKKSTTFKGQAKPYGKSGHFHESRRHSLQARGIKTGRLSIPLPMGRTFETDKEREQFAYESITGGEAFVERYDPKTKSWVRDTDGDGVPDAEDCDPNDPAMQDSETELMPVHDSAKSFYGKAHVRGEDGKLILQSYDTDVAYIEDGQPHVKGYYSQTTMRHIKEFLRQHGFKAENKKQILEDYGI